MTSRVLGWLLVLLLGGMLGILIQREPGYVMLSYQQYSLEMSLWVLLLLVAIFYFIWDRIIQLLRFLLRAPANIRRWKKTRDELHIRNQTLAGWQNLLEGCWRTAYRQLTESADASSVPLLNAIGAARAARALGKTEDTDKWLARAAQQGEQGQVIAALDRAQNCINEGDQQTARKYLQEAAAIKAKHPYLLSLKHWHNDNK